MSVSIESLNKIRTFIEAYDGTDDLQLLRMKLLYVLEAYWMIEDTEVRCCCQSYLHDFICEVIPAVESGKEADEYV